MLRRNFNSYTDDRRLQSVALGGQWPPIPDILQLIQESHRELSLLQCQLGMRNILSIK